MVFMKQARKVQIPSGVLDVRTAERLRIHAIRSAFWYADNEYTTAQIREKLYDKGFTDEVHVFARPGRENGVIDFVGTAIDTLLERHPDHDSIILNLKTSKYLRAGKSAAQVKRELEKIGYTPETIQGALFAYDEEQAIRREALSIAKSKHVQSYKTYTQRKEKVVALLTRRMFPYHMIQQAVAEDDVRENLRAGLIGAAAQDTTQRRGPSLADVLNRQG